MSIQWYPGHMTRAKRQMQEDLKLIDLVIELVDARAPLASRNPDIDQMAQGKARMILLNKADLADENRNGEWKDWFLKKGIQAVQADSRSGAGIKEIQSAIQTACRKKMERDLRRGIKNRPVRAMVAGIPNVGKSTFINSFARRACTKTGNRPGVTRGKQWIRLNKSVELLDTPGILWPKLGDEKTAENLAFIGSISDDILNMEELSLKLAEFLVKNYPGILKNRYEAEEESAPFKILEAVARSRGCLRKSGELDYGRAAGILFDDFRGGKLGRVTLETAPAEQDKK